MQNTEKYIDVFPCVQKKKRKTRDFCTRPYCLGKIARHHGIYRGVYHGIYHAKPAKYMVFRHFEKKVKML